MSFLKQYHIHDFDGYLKTIPWDKYCRMVSVLDETTPLIRMAQIRKETDPRIIETWPEEQKRINREWQYNIAKRDAENASEEEMAARYAAFSEMLSGMVKK